MRGKGKAARRLRANDDRGMSAVEFVVLTPIMFLLLMLTVQFAIYMFARQAAQSAVHAGGRVAREEAASKGCDSPQAQWIGDAEQAVVDRATNIGRNLIDSTPAPVLGTSSTKVPAGALTTGKCVLDTVTVTYHAWVPTIVPGMHLQVDVVSSGPIEQPVVHR
jgi:Flp pilus assembly protein TadG